MPDQAPHILYLGVQLPVRSETFVYREVFALRQLGYSVRVASVRPPERNLGSEDLERLASEAISIYGDGGWALLRDALSTCWRRPGRSSWVVGIAVRDALLGRGVPLTSRPKLLVQCVAALALVHRTRSIALDHVHAHMAHVPTSIAMYFALTRDLPYSFTGHAADLFRDYSLLPDKIRRAAFVSCISHWHREFYRQQVPDLADDKLPIVRCGVQIPPVDPSFSASHSPFQILAVGRLVEKKGFDVLLRALAKVRLQSPDFVCRLVGDGPEREPLLRLIQQLDLTEQIRMEGARDNHEVQKWMQQADLVVLPCRITESGDRDGIPVVLMEAMAAAVPAISGDLPTIRELIRHGETGWLVPPGRVEPLEQAILELMSDPELRQRLAACGRDWVEDEFSQAINVKRLSDALSLDEPHGEAGCRERQLC